MVRLPRGDPDRQGNPGARRRGVPQDPQHAAASCSPNLYDFDPATDQVPSSALEPVDRYILARYAELTLDVLRAYAALRLSASGPGLNAFATVDLSAFYVDVTKDRLYTLGTPIARHGAPRRRRCIGWPTDWPGCWRRSCRSPPTALAALPGKREDSVHLAEFPDAESLDAFVDPDLTATGSGCSRCANEVNVADRGAPEGKAVRHAPCRRRGGDRRRRATDLALLRTVRSRACRCCSSSRT